MNYSKIYYIDTINGEGLRVSLFTSGCTIHCKGCFNKETWDFNHGESFTKEELEKIINTIFNDKGINYSGLSLLGGEPLDNIDGLIPLLKEFKKKNKDNKKDVWIWTGRTIDYVNSNEKMKNFLLEYCDVVVAGPYIEEEKNLKLRFRGSNNQKIYLIKNNHFIESEELEKGV